MRTWFICRCRHYMYYISFACLLSHRHWLTRIVPDKGHKTVVVCSHLSFFLHFFLIFLPSVLWRCWLGGRKGIRPVKNWVVRYWRGCLSGARGGWFAYGPADANATSSSLALLKSRMAVPFCCRLTEVVLEKRLLNGLSVWWLTNYYF